MPSKSKALKLVLLVVGYVFTLGEAIAPSFFTFRRIIAQNDVGPNTCFPYELIWLNGVLQLAQAARKDDRAGIAVYTVVVSITLIYCGLYLRYSSGRFRRLAWVMVGLKFLIIVGLLVVEFIVFADDKSDKIDNLHKEMILVITCVTYLSPAMEVIDAYNTHDVGGVDILLSLAFLGNGIVSIISACLPFDGFNIVGGLMGVVCASGQIFVWLRCYYHDHHLHVHPITRLLELMGRG